MVSIRRYHPRDLEGCRRLWVELTEWHRSIFETPSIGGDDPGSRRRLAETVIEHAREHGFRQLQVRPVGRNAEAIRFFHRLGFDVLDQVGLMLDLVPSAHRPWRDGELVAGRSFRV